MKLALGKDKTEMATMNRLYSLYSDRLESALEKRDESRVLFMRSYKTKHMRENVALARIQE